MTDTSGRAGEPAAGIVAPAHTSITSSIARHIADAATAPTDPHVSLLTRLHLLDTLASVVACRDLAAATIARRYAVAVSGSPSGTTILGSRDRASIVDATFAGAMAGHGAEINDFMPSVFVQPGPAIVSTALGVSERASSSGEAVERAITVGYEIAACMPRLLGAQNLRRAGIASHGVGPLFGAAATAASLLGMDSEAIGHVLSCCAQQASGSWQWLSDVEHIEKAFVFAGLGARGGLQAALLVDAGYRGVSECLDHPGGWRLGGAFAAGDSDPAAALADLGDRRALHDAAFKRYPVGGPAQPAVEALIDLVGEIDRDEVTAVQIAMPGRAEAFANASMPALNLAYLTAIILVDGRLDFLAAQSLDRMHGDPDVAALMARVEVTHDPEQEAGHGRDRTESAHVTVTLASGTTVARRVEFVRGFPSHPMSADDVERKAIGLIGPTLGEARAAEIVATCRSLGSLARAADLVDLVAR